MPDATVKKRGRVIKKPFATGSKSERHAVVLQTPDGEFVLRREGGNAFQDKMLDELVGKKIEFQGRVHGYTFIVNSWNEESATSGNRNSQRKK
jgi:hypothetical protein